MPIIPFVTDRDKDLEGMVQIAAEIGVDYLVYNVLRLRGQVVRGYYFQALKKYAPDLFAKRSVFMASRSYPPPEYTERIRDKKWSFIVKNIVLKTTALLLTPNPN